MHPLSAGLPFEASCKTSNRSVYVQEDNSMREVVQAADRERVKKAVEKLHNGGATISQVVEALVSQAHIPPAKARYIVRAALDKGDVRTDRNFRLHLALDH